MEVTITMVVLHHRGVLDYNACTPVFLIYAQRYCTIYMALRLSESG